MFVCVYDIRRFGLDSNRRFRPPVSCMNTTTLTYKYSANTSPKLWEATYTPPFPLICHTTTCLFCEQPAFRTNYRTVLPSHHTKSLSYVGTTVPDPTQHSIARHFFLLFLSCFCLPAFVGIDRLLAFPILDLLCWIQDCEEWTRGGICFLFLSSPWCRSRLGLGM